MKMRLPTKTLPSNYTYVCLAALFALSAMIANSQLLAQPSKQLTVDTALKAHEDGNHSEAYESLRSWLLSDAMQINKVDRVYTSALNCLASLNRVNEIDELREAMLKKHGDEWNVFWVVARSYLGRQHQGYLIAGEFQRGQHRGGGQVANAVARDRVQALQLYLKAYQLSQQENVNNTGRLLFEFADALRHAHHGNEAWRLQSLTDLDTLPDYEEGWHRGGGGTQGAPVDEEGNPVFYALPSSWDAAKNDGERWRWVLQEYSNLSDRHHQDVLQARASFLQEQFGVETLSSFRGWIGRQSPDDDKQRAGIYALKTLTDNETIARLATGIKRFKLPDEHNHLKLFQELLELQQKAGTVNHNYDTPMHLARVYLNRQQYSRAIPYVQTAIEHSKGKQRENYQRQLDQVVQNWGRFETSLTQPAGRGAELEFVFRNGNQVEFTAHRINIRQLITDVKAYLKSNPQRMDWQETRVDNLGYRLVRDNQAKYLQEKVASWQLELDPLDDHFDRRIPVATPLQKAGAYLLTAKMADGNTSRIIVWIADTAIVRKPMPGQTFYFVADAVSGTPIEKANVEFFGYRQDKVATRKYQVFTDQFADFTNADGQVFLSSERNLIDRKENKHGNKQWIAIATTADGRLAFHGFSAIWANDAYDEEYSATKVFAVTDRPVYRPDQTVEFKFWVRQAKYDLDNTSQFAHKSFQIEIHDPRGEKVYSQSLAADEYGGIEGKFEIPSGATLGQYSLVVVNRGGGSFRVEEYKKPEFEVTVEAPSEPIALGEKVTATISAKYYFGSPVSNATVRYKVMRTPHTETWYPPSPWDWFYGPGYWWFSYDYDWYPGWNRWGCVRPSPWWLWRAPTPPEIVAEREVEIGADGTVEVEIDTALAKLLHGNQDHNYQIQAEVVDASRRTIVGNGKVLVSRKPFKVFAWVDRGHYRVGDTVLASFAARRLDSKPVQGNGKLKLLKLSYDDPDSIEPTETEVRQWDLSTDAEGQAKMKINASEKGIYRLSYTVTDKAKHVIEGGYVFTIMGEGFDGRDYQFNDLELIPDRRDYAPGEKVQLRVNTNQVGSTVLLFVRPTNGVYAAPPQVLRIDGKSTLVELDIEQKDMPNFFVEAVTIAEGRVHTQTRELHVPPAKRVLNVEVVPSATEYKPGEKAEVKLKLTDEAGEPFVGSTVLAIYDKSVEYISGGSNVGDIKEFFWKWRRRHQPQSQSTLDRVTNNLVGDNEISMGSLGIFGYMVADQSLIQVGDGFGRSRRTYARSSGVSRGLGIQNFSVGSPVAAPMAAAAMPQSGIEDASKELIITPVASQSSAVEELIEPSVRQQFADTALWIGSLKTGDDGLASAELIMPENLTTWKVRVWGMGHGTRVGEGSAEVVTRKNLIVRLQAPRFFVERDEVVLSANVHNYLPEAKQVTVRLELDESILQPPSVLEETIEIEAGGEQRVDWTVNVLRNGEAMVRMLALTDQESDAVEQKFPAYVHGIEKMDSYSGALAREDTVGSFEMNVPADRRVEDTRLEVRYSPHLGGCDGRCPALLDRLSPRLHRANAQPLLAGCHYPANVDPHGN